MSLDGSFSCESVLERFLARFPNLQKNLKLTELMQKGDSLTVEEVANSLAELFLHPNYTIPLLGCFRSLNRKIVDKTVTLLRLVPSFKSHSLNAVEEIGEEEIGVIDFYVRSERGLELHELASLAFCRALDLAPFLLRSILVYFSFAPPPFQRLLMMDSTSHRTEKGVSHVLDVIRVSFRFLLMEPKVISELWDWSCFLALVKQYAYLELRADSIFYKDVLDIRWCVIQILSIILRISDRATVNFGLGEEEALACLFRWEEFCQDVSLEKAGFYLEATPETGCLDEIVDFSEQLGLHSFEDRPLATSKLEPIRRNRWQATCDVRSAEIPFVLTSTVKKSFEMVQLAMSQKWPVLLHGPIGAGKTALINKLAQVRGNKVLFVHMDEQLDIKTLIGSYICTEKPGEFRWQPGSLSQAVLNGFWVVFEDLDKAPSELQSTILPLLEGASSFVTGRGEAINVKEGFQLFATVSSSKHDFTHTAEVRSSLCALWRKVMIGPASNEDLLAIINAWYPNLEPLWERLIETFERVNAVMPYQLGGSQVGTSSLRTFSRFLLRDLLKWCKRITGLGCDGSGLALSASTCKSIYIEAVDIFAASSASPEIRLSIMKEIAKLWGVPSSEAETLYPPNKPIIRNFLSGLQVGRVILEATQTAFRHERPAFVDLRSSLQVLERITCSVKYNEPVLLVGETGTGKTTLVQNLAMRLGHQVTVLNLSQQSDTADLLGGFKPTDARLICFPLYQEFKDLFRKTFSGKDNEEFLRHIEIYVMEKKWKRLLDAFKKAVAFFLRGLGESGDTAKRAKRKRPLAEDVLHGWESFSSRLDSAHKQIFASTSMSFSFVEGAFITALKKGYWILLDEVNLAPPETLQRIIGVLEGDRGSLCLAERGDVDYIYRHPDFRMFACMNPATDAGKRDLPFSLRSRFTEYFVDDIVDDEDLILFINQYMDDIHSNREIVDRIVRFYKAAKRDSEERLVDGANQKPQFSLRSLARALEYTRKAAKKFGFHKALYDGFCMFFLTLLDPQSAKLMYNTILSYLFGGKMPPNIPFDSYFVESEKYKELPKSDAFLENYVLTRSIKEHLGNLARASFIKRYPVLLQGPTSSGKTSLVRYLAAVTGHEFVRINNHEHTDLQEYFGSYITDSRGKLVFQEGILVKAVRNGYWIVLDELNLAPSDVLEALNRLLDDNRELFVPELQEVVPAHPDFMLFATQNPPTLYGGRKILSRAFRNRFLEIHVDEIPEDELSTILENRCKIPASYAMKMVDVMKDLQLHRQSSKVFAGKHGFITPRDLFRWADRFRMFGNSYEDLAKDGYFLLAERLRDGSEKNVVHEILERRLCVKFNEDDLYAQEYTRLDAALELCKQSDVLETLGKIIWTKSMRKLYFLIERCYKLREPVLLVGETGGGKTTVCQLLSLALRSRLDTLNCHQYTETSDFLGAFYPVRDRSKLAIEFMDKVEKVKLSKVFLHFSNGIIISLDIKEASSTLDLLNQISNYYKLDAASHPVVTQPDMDDFERAKVELFQLQQKWQTLFLWQDGPLVQAMKGGSLFLVDEISLADDSVLERLNSVLEPERKLFLAEKGGSVLEEITAHPNFFILATMNPGGDYGKKELSPALRNRFTEIWVPPVTDLDELKSIAAERFVKSELQWIADHMLKFWEWFNRLQTGRMLTVRDLLSWVAFINETERSLGANFSFIHGAFLVLLDGLSLGTGLSRDEAVMLRERGLSFLLEQLKMGGAGLFDTQFSKLEVYGWGDSGRREDSIVQSDNLFGVNPFYIAKGDKDCERDGFEFLAPTTCRNVLRVLRAMQLPKPVLLEGSPGVGKTSLIVALANFSGHTVVRINLSEQTDIMDLLGSDLPAEDEKGMKFAWSDGILLQALKNGSWVLLDELNLAPQSVLEGLNAILDHRAEVYLPELGITFKCPPSFRVFACQNPSSQGGGRKGLPKSFLNRFTKVYLDELVDDDYLSICSSLHPSISKPLLSKLICFNNRLYEDTMVYHKYGQDGSPWEFNLRDVIRSCQIIEGAPEKSRVDCFLSTVYIQRMRRETDRREVLKLYEEIFGVTPFINPHPRVQINPQYLSVGNAFVERNHYQPTKILRNQLHLLPGFGHSLEAALNCVQHQWLCIMVGPSSSGKTSLIRLLSQLTGNVLNELNLSSGTEISELLGCFEQYDAFRNLRSVIAEVEHYIAEYSSLRLVPFPEGLAAGCRDLIARWLSFLSSINYSSSMSSFDSAFGESWKSGSCNMLGELVEIIKLLQHDIEKYKLPVSMSHRDLNKSLNTVLVLHENSRTQSFSSKFEWVTGLLIKAVERGEWVILENANLCNPTVLDRINSLVEPTRSITINECGLVDGKPVILHAHPNFRMFLTVNPRYGEVSRAMRNRGVEVFMMQSDWLHQVNGYDCKETEARNVETFLVLSGIPIYKLVVAMSKAHIYARDAGLHLGIHLTLLELTRWVQLFQQLLMTGNRLRWSLQLSWEHTYLSSLGEAEGKDIIMHAKQSFLSRSEAPELDLVVGCSLSLPGGWPEPLKLGKFLFFSTESSIKKNVMYLEFLGAQCGAYELSVDKKESMMIQAGSITATGNLQTSLLNNSKKLKPFGIPFQMLHAILFPTSSSQKIFMFNEHENFDLALANKMLFFAANWTIEQATENDLLLYDLWFNWYSTRLQPYCSFFKSFLAILKQERDRPIWMHIVDCWREIISCLEINVVAQPIPLLSLDLVELAASNEKLKSFRERLYNASRSVSLLRLSFQQWNAEDHYAYGEEKIHFSVLPVLKSLRQLEEGVLDVIVESPYFDILIQLYNQLLEYHTLFWKGITMSQFEGLLISWRSLKKVAIKLHGVFPGGVDTFLAECRNLDKLASWKFNSPKPMLWVHGGHPFLPSSQDIYSKMQQLVSFCDVVWPKTTISSKQEKDYLVEAVVSTNTELRYLAMQGVCMSSYIISKGGQDDAAVVHQLDEIYQMLLGRYEFEKHKMEAVLASTTQFPNALLVESTTSACCTFCPEMLCRKPGFDSWLETLPLLDEKSFLLDFVLFQELSNNIFVDASELYLVLSKSSKLLEYVMNFSLSFSSRTPIDFSPHQKLLWMLDAWSSVDSGQIRTKVACFLLELWYQWHQSLWSCSSKSVKNVSQIDYKKVSLPCILFQPTKTATLDQILHGTFPIKDYPVHSLKLRVASRNLWQDAPLEKDLPSILLSTACSHFQQIICAHKKSFSKNEFGEIQSIFGSMEENPMTEGIIQTLKSLFKSSSHSGLTSLMETFIEPLLKELYLKSSSYGYLFNLGLAWLHIGGLRFNLLLNADDLDPSMKYAFKNSQLQEKISLLELEIKVRQECDNLAGRNSTRDDQKQRISSVEKLKIEQERLQTKVVFRSDPAKFKKLKSEFVDFLDLVSSSVKLAKNLESGDMNFQLLIDQACNWQETSARFINRLSEEYAMYVDIVQPVQVAIYELKLGISLLVSSSYQRAFLDKVGEDNIDRILETIYSFMQFPRGCEDEPISIKVNTMQHKLISCNLDVSENIWLKDLHLLKKIFSTPRDTSPDKAASVMQLHATVYHIIFVRVAQHVSSSLLMDNSSFLLLNEVFDQFASLWMNMKVQAKGKEDDDAQNYKFRPRAVKIGDIIEVGISALGNFPPEEGLSSEWQEMLAEQAFTEVEASKEHENLEDEWNLIQESILGNMVRIHNQLFGSNDLVEHPGACQVTDEDKLHSFIDSYKLGTRVIQDLHALYATTLDASLLPEHLLYLCLEYGQKFGPCHQSAHAYNIYKDANAPAMVKMVQPLTALQEKLISHLNEWPEHPGLQKILDVTKMLLAIPLDTPLAKPLLGLQLLLSRAQLLQENASKFSLSVQLQPIFVLVSSWQKMELDCWPALLDGVMEQCEVNARKLWFPLHSLIHRELSGGTDGDNLSTIQSLEEFVQTASVGEFKSRLGLLLAFHGQFYTSICLKSNMSSHVTENLKILYNVFGYYVQFMPLIREHIDASRRNVETEIKELLKLCKWEHSNCYLSIESSNRTRQKLWKLVQNFNEILQQPLMVILDQEAAKRGIKVPAYIETKLFNESHVMNVELLTDTAEQSQFSDSERSLWYSDWRKKVDSALQDLHSRVTCGFDFPYTSFKSTKDVANLVSQFLSSGFHIYQEGWITLEKICRHSTECSHLWKDGTKNLQKRRVLSDLLKLLESCGLSKHKSMIAKAEIESNQLSSWFLQPSYDVKHLLLPPDRTCARNVNSTLSSRSCKFPDESFDSNWEMANRFYFKSMAMVQHLRQICLNFHKDFTLEQVKRSSSFLDHLIIIQQEQRYVAYGFAEQLRNLRILTSSLQDLDHRTGTGSSVSPKQHDINKCMWQQKKLFDHLYSISNDASLLLKTVENAHLDTCNSVRVEAKKVSVFIDKFSQQFHKSKELLDEYLLACKGILTTSVACSSPFIVSRQMEELVMHNFQVIHDFEEELQTFREHSLERRSLKEPLLNHFRDVINKAKVVMEEDHAEPNSKYQSLTIPEEDACYTEVFTRLNASFVGRFEETIKQIITAFERLRSVSKFHTSDESSMGNIVSWKVQFESCTTALGIDLIYDEVVKTLVVAVELANHGGYRKPDTCSQLEIYLNHLRMLMDLLLTIGDRLLFEFLAMHKTVAEMTYMLANIFSSLYSRGFGTAEDQVDNADGGISQDASGTGMGEGEGLNDVSDQIDDEAQLLGTSEKEREGPDASDNVPNKNNKGIEMDQDFAGDTFSVSEDSADDDSECSEDVNLDSAMGETGDGSEIVDEKLWDKNEDDAPDKSVEKYEPGASAKETDSSSRELRAKEDDAIMDDSGDLNHNESDGLSENGENPDVADDDETNEMNVDKETAFGEPSGIKLDDQNQGSEDTGIGEPEGSDTMDEEADSDTKEGTEEMGEEDGRIDQIDEDMVEENSMQVDEKLGRDEPGSEHAESTEMDLVPTGKEAIDSEVLDLPDDLGQDSDSAKPMNDSGAADTTLALEKSWSNSSDFQNGLAPSKGLPSSDVPEMEIDVPDSSKDGKLTVDQEKIQSPHQDVASVQRAQPNPYRCVGDALEEWKERIKVSVDSEEHKSAGPDDDAQDENANEYGFVSKVEDGTSQALGPATSVQIDKNMRGSKPNVEESIAKHNKESDEIEIERQEESETHFVKSYSAYTPKQKTNEHLQNTVVSNETHMEESLEIVDHQEDMSHDLVSIKDSSMNHNILQLSNLSMSGEELEKARNIEISGDMKQNAAALWRRYELVTTRLSQELAEQLRLVMEPTLAGKLQGDYKTGKRINMKKVIPYIASHFRKDKIWLRRTRPNKRDYQVVVAVDDSRSMSESHCGNFAIEALVTVCRAMSQLEVGQLAVASFGETGNIKLLHEFDKPFTGDAGVKMISSFSFKQDNTIADEPVVDLLRYLNTMLDNAVASARLPSGQNPLQQLILIIADGRFHEKENLKRCVRNVLSRGRMIAFLLLDSPQESIMDLKEVSFQGETLTFPKYLISFPFPYYVILKNIEALPRTLADLLRQWFELMQNARE